MSLATAQIAHPLRVTRVRGGPRTIRLMEMGLFEGAEVRLIGRAPLGDPLHISVGDYQLSLRSADAELVDVASA